jgi:hypothetical protein
MRRAATVVGINRTQDASIAIASGGREMTSLQKERVSRRKHHWGRLGDVRDLYVPTLPELREPIDLIVECYSSDDELRRLDAYRDELEQSLRFRNGTRAVRISHHVAHAYSAFHPSPFDRSATSRNRSPAPPAPTRTCWRSRRSTAASAYAATLSASASSCGTGIGRGRSGWAASTTS